MLSLASLSHQELHVEASPLALRGVCKSCTQHSVRPGSGLCAERAVPHTVIWNLSKGLCPRCESSVPSPLCWRDPYKAAGSTACRESVDSSGRARTSPFLNQTVKLSFVFEQNSVLLYWLKWCQAGDPCWGPTWSDQWQYKTAQFSSVQSLSRVLLCDPVNRSMPGLPVHHQLPEFTQTHVHRVGDAIQPSHPLSSPSPPALNPSQHQGLFQWVNSSHEVAKVLEFQL